MRRRPSPRLHHLAKTLILLLISAGYLTAQDLPPPQNTAALLKELEQITSSSQSLSQRHRAEAISLIQSANSSGSNYERRDTPSALAKRFLRVS
ncbi:MAG: hypothetical protein WCO97_07970 [bacterium]